MSERFRYSALTSAALLSAAHFAAASTVNINDLDLLTPTTTFSTGTISSSRYNDGSVDADANLDSTSDVTFAFETTIHDKTPGSNRTLFEFGGSTTGFSLLLRASGDLTLQLRDGSGNRELGGDSTALMYAVPDALLDVSTSIVASVDLSGSNATVRLFINNQFIGAATGKVATDWAGTNDGGFFARSDEVLSANFTDGGFNGPNPSEAVADSTLRAYENIDVVAASESIAGQSATFSFINNASNSNSAFGSGNYINTDNFLAAGAGPMTLTGTLPDTVVHLTLEDVNAGNFNINTLGLGSTQDGNNSWSPGDAFDLTFDKPVTLDTLWLNHGDSSDRTMQMQVILNPGEVDEQNLGIITIIDNTAAHPYAMLFGSESAQSIVINPGTVVRLLQPGLSSDATRISGITVTVLPAPAALPAGLMLLSMLTTRRRFTPQATTINRLSFI
ncbi:MAG: hypothetical protein GC162_03625 [Planctomycetes bacterium]|nr:hypothetical protein [Planctomycetota bacterium]